MRVRVFFAFQVQARAHYTAAGLCGQMWKLESVGEQCAVYCSWVWHRSHHCYLARNSLLNCSGLDCQESRQNWAKQREIVPQNLLVAGFAVLCIGIKVLGIYFHWSGLSLDFCLRQILCFCAGKYCSIMKIKAGCIYAYWCMTPSISFQENFCLCMFEPKW